MIALTDVREGGRWTFRQRVKNDALFAIVTATIAIAERIPLRVLRGAGAALGAIAYALASSARRIARANVNLAFPELDDAARTRIVRRAYRALGIHLGEAIATLDPARPLEPLPFTADARACFAEALREGHGVVFASAHLGPWERLATTLVDSGIPMTVVAREAYDPRLTRLYERLRGARGVQAIWRGSPGAGTALLRALRRGGVLGIPMDLASRVPSVDAPFLGALAPTPVGPARLALRTGAAVIVGTVAPSDDGLAITATRIATAGHDEIELTTRINDELSARIRALPEAWVWMHPRWPARTL